MPERRQRVRILTLKNFGRTVLAALVLLVAVNLLSEARRTHGGDYGRLFNKELAKTETVQPRKVEVVTEAPAVADHDTADPLLLAPAARQQQYLDVKPLDAHGEVLAAASQTPLRESDHGRVAIVGDEGGVTVVGSPRRVLTGGFGR